MNKSNLTSGYYIFGNKGAVWSNQVHIAKNSDSTTLCKTPMLSSNWARIQEVEHIGCEECLNKYKEQNSK